MQSQPAADIRERYQRFFEARGHTRVPPAPLLARDDPTLLFTNSGMVQFKRVLTGEERRDYTRAVDAQPCLRVAGKHNDFEEVGRTPRHQTLFEMLGNWSFGDYFKREAIHWAWEFLTDELQIDPSRLAATVYTDDDDAYAIWADEIGLPSERIVRWGNIAEGDDHNFWQMADVGALRPVQRDPLRPGGGAERRARVRARSLRVMPAVARVLEPGLHAVRPGRRTAP